MISRVVYWIFGLIETLLALRIVLSLLGANKANMFAQFIYNVSEPLARPFFSLFGYEPSYGAMHLEVGTVVALIVYAIVAAALMSILRTPHSRADI
jgi:uncharacterized protein YggT (Ycf19 family)